ncbi:toxin glutamine deamidase domain-containing protein [Paenibacillus sp. FSL K6-2524]|uniref:toxin glutamine deamidase domain-containing protein n=1 Tax=Paenibacillus sp. FSL K6-2524 TaxID=2954516 RepID=UPI0030FB95C9
MGKLQKDLQEISDDTNYLRTKTQGFLNEMDRELYNRVSGEAQLAQSQINRLADDSEQLSNFIRLAITKIQGAELQNVADAIALMKGSARVESWGKPPQGKALPMIERDTWKSWGSFSNQLLKDSPKWYTTTTIPPFLFGTFRGLMLQLERTTLIDRMLKYKGDAEIAALLEMMQHGSIQEQMEAEQKLDKISDTLIEVGRCQAAYEIYKQFGRTSYMEFAHGEAEKARTLLSELGVSKTFYDENVQLTSEYTGTPLSACLYNPLKHDYSILPTDNRLLTMIRLSMGDREYREWAKENYDDFYEEIKATEVSAEGPVLGAYDPSKTVSEEELITGKSNRYTREQLRMMWNKLSPESQSDLRQARQANWFISGGPIRATLFKKVIEPFGNMLDSVISNPMGDFLSRSTYIPGVSVGVQESTGNETADKVSSFIGSNAAPFFVPTGAPFRSGPMGAPYDAANKLLNTGAGQQVVSKLGTGIEKIPFVTSNFAQGIARVGLAEGMAGGVQNPASMLVNNSDRSAKELLMDSAIGFGAGFALGMGGYAIREGIGAGVSKVLGKGNVPDSILNNVIDQVPGGMDDGVGSAYDHVYTSTRPVETVFPELKDINPHYVEGAGPGVNINCTSCANATHSRLSGVDSEAIAQKMNGYGYHSDLLPSSPWGFEKPATVSEVIEMVSKKGDGYTGPVVIHQGNIFHVINVVNKNGEVFFIDSQIGKIVELDPKLILELGKPD